MDVGVRLLGTPEARAGGAWLPLGPTRPHAALVYVAASGGFVRRAELADLLWPGLDDEHAYASLRQALQRLSRGAFAGLLARDRMGLWLACDCDVAGFRRAVAERRWSDAVEVHAGPLLLGFELDDADEFSAWLAGERAAVAEDWRRACRALLADATREGRRGDALRYADLLIRADPLDEQAVREAMQAAAADGDPLGVTRRYRELASLLRRECGVEPEVETRALFERLVARPTPGPQAAVSFQLESVRPRIVGERRGLVGREQALADLIERLRQRESRLITLLGPGGIGKTALASALVAELRSAFPDGAVLVPLEGAEGADAVGVAVAHATDVRVGPRAPVGRQLVRALQARRMLVVLDGFEAFVGQLPCVDTLLRGTRGLQLVVTSRVRLRHSAEVVVEVDPLATRGRRPAGTAVGPSAVSPAAQLFLRAAAGRLPLATVRGFELDRVERIVEALGGHPLAIELSASWVDVLGVDLLEEQLGTSWLSLSSDDVDRSPRRRDVRAVIEEVWQQLDPAARSAWVRLAAMPGSIDAAVAAEVGGCGWQVLRRLLDRAVLRHRDARLELHPLLARFGREQAAAGDEGDEAWRATRAIWRTRIAREVNPRTGRRVVVHPDDLDQAVGVWRRACAERDWPTVADMAVGLMRALDQRMRWPLTLELRREAVDRLVAAPGGRARDVALARLWPLEGRTTWAKQANAARALTLADARGDDLARGQAHARLARGDFGPEREAHLREARAAFERAGDEVGHALMLGHQGHLSILAGQLDHAVGLLEEAWRRHERLADLDGLAFVLLGLARIDAYRGDLAAGRARLDQVRALLAGGEDADHEASTPKTLAVEAALARAAGDREEAACRLAAFARIASDAEGASYEELVLRLADQTRFGSPPGVLESADRLLRDPETVGGRTIIRMLAHLAVATAHARADEPELGLDHLRDAVRLALPWDVPRVVARIAATAAVVALARGQTAFAGRMADAALRHPALEFEARAGAEAVWAAVGREAFSPVAPPAPAAVPAADLLSEVEAWLAQ
jgi:DNA-binding SARP family transcriptional activator/predicted ATPase/tetratricopeptide (TPR) repeat protein